MAPSPRHWRFLRNHEFDVAEVSGSGYVAARDQGLPFRAIPVFLHRRFRHGFVFINTGKGITKPTDLIGRKVGSKGYLVTAGAVAARHPGARIRRAAKSIEWFTELDEDVDVHAAAGSEASRSCRPTQSLEPMLAEGEIDALLHPDLIKPLLDGIRASAGCSPTTSRRRSRTTARPASSRSCT